MKNNKPDISLIRKYLNGELDSQAMYRLEREAQDDPRLMDMIQGMEAGNREQDERTLKDIDRLISNRVAAGGKSISFIPWKGWIAAASIVLIATMAALWIFKTPQQNDIQQKQAQVKASGDRAVPDTTEKMMQGSQLKNSARSAMLKNRGLKNPLPDNSGMDPATHTAANSAVNPALHKNPTLTEPVKGLQNTVKTQKPGIQGIPDSAIISGLAGNVTPGNTKNELEEVVVVGYPGMRKSTTLSAAATVKPDTAAKALAGKVAGLSEVVVQANGTKRQAIPSAKPGVEPAPMPLKLGKAHPVIGWDAYKKYLKDNATIPAGDRGNVTLVFMIDKDGSPAHVIVIKGLNEEADRKAAALIRNGSKWTGDAEEMTKMITIKIKFH